MDPEVKAYIATFPRDVQTRLKQLRKIILDTAPEAVECFSYKMPAYKYKGKNLVYFSGFQHHIGFYALPTAHEEFQEDLKSYKKGKGSVQFPHSKELPVALIERMVRFNVDKLRSATTTTTAKGSIKLKPVGRKASAKAKTTSAVSNARRKPKP